MNAYELAEQAEGLAYEIPADWSSGEPKNVATDIANMLRQQAQAIATLSDRIAELEKSAEPVAWIKKDTLIFLGNYEFGSITIQVQKQKDNEFDIPLYTTPQIKELSDRELVVFLMDEIDRASKWLVDGETHMAIGVLGQCHAKIRKHLSNTKESE
jgi:hypothetical protein